jgi:adenosylhomocysteine nucleosidase
VKILVTFALDAEFAPWRRLRTFEPLPELSFIAYESREAGIHLRVILTGVGLQHAQRVTKSALRWQPDVCISSGLAGSLRPILRVGEVFVPREVMELETGRIQATDDELFNSARNHGATVVERSLSTENMVLSADGKSRLGRMAEAVDMEGFAVISEGQAKEIPSVAIRAISDSADEDLPLNFGEMLDSRGNLVRSKLTTAVMRAPHKLHGLIRLGRNSRRAAAILTRYLDVFVNDIPQLSSHRSQAAAAVRA